MSSLPEMACFRLGDVAIGIEAELHGSVERFLVSEEKPEILIRTGSVQWQELPLAGEDRYRRYYSDGRRLQVFMKGLNGKPDVLFSYENGEGMLEVRLGALTPWLGFLPIDFLLYPYGVVTLHGSRVVWEGGAIVFIGRSGIGKTTQARLWEQAGARIAGNDRVLLRRRQVWQTYGHFKDGSAPVYDPTRIPLRAIVCLDQGKTDSVERLSPGKAVSRIMNQTFAQTWCGEMKDRLLEEVLSLVSEIPVYHQICTPTMEAVRCLQGVLKE